jgi:hypothetical protein
MTLDETECELLTRPTFTRNSFINPPAPTTDEAAQLILKHYRIIKFRSRLLIEVGEPYAHFEPLYKDRFDRIAGPILLGYGRSQVNGTFHYLKVMAPDLSHT